MPSAQSNATMPLKYLFTATYADGSKIVQTPDDKSVLDPEKRSQFYDVLKKGESTPLVSFVLKGDGHEYGVDLRDGHFEIDGVSFRMHEYEVVDLELVFFRQHTHSFIQARVKDTEISHTVAYRIGWKLKSDPRNIRVMEID